LNDSSAAVALAMDAANFVLFRVGLIAVASVILFTSLFSLNLLLKEKQKRAIDYLGTKAKVKPRANTKCYYLDSSGHIPKSLQTTYIDSAVSNFLFFRASILSFPIFPRALDSFSEEVTGLQLSCTGFVSILLLLAQLFASIEFSGPIVFFVTGFDLFAFGILEDFVDRETLLAPFCNDA
jgi:hypothetical protein